MSWTKVVPIEAWQKTDWLKRPNWGRRYPASAKQAVISTYQKMAISSFTEVQYGKRPLSYRFAAMDLARKQSQKT